MIFRQLRYLGLCALLVALNSAWATTARATTFEFATVEQGRAVRRAFLTCWPALYNRGLTLTVLPCKQRWSRSGPSLRS
jgi:hypothetical protein